MEELSMLRATLLVLFGTATAVSTLSASAAFKVSELPGTHTEIVSTTDITPRLGLQESRLTEIPLFAAIKAAVGTPDETSVQDRYGIQDPAVLISSLVSERLSQLTSLPVRQTDGAGQSESALPSNMRKPQEIAAQFGTGKLVVSSSTQRWAFFMFGQKYQLQLHNVVQIVDTTSGKRITREGCMTPLRRADAPNIDDLKNDDGAALKTELDFGTRHCAGKIAHELFGDPEDIFLRGQ